MIYLEEIPMATMQRIIVDSAKVDANGRYKLQTGATETGIYNLRLDQNTYPLTSIVNDAPKIMVDAVFSKENGQFAESYEVKGSPASQKMSAIAAHPDRLGIGIDEDTCALFEGDDILQVLGKGTVTIIDPGEMTYTNQTEIGATDPLCMCNLRVHLLSHGSCYDLRKRITIAPGHK
ncbi:MAG: hypothetical protein HC936_09820 [Leptolyngbyaceae cyanobacterium SU_3_3]|nr:hypothetical protein [Leptolyngbyaceae cyanobacterium SU_3_3]